MTGIPELDAQYAGLTIESKVILQSLEHNKIRLAVSILVFSLKQIFWKLDILEAFSVGGCMRYFKS